MKLIIKSGLIYTITTFIEETGNPFVDAGLWALTILSNKDQPNQLEKLDLKNQSELLSSILSEEAWRKNLYSIFPNNKITNPSIKDPQGEYNEYLSQLLKDIHDPSKSGTCISCGIRNVTQKRGKHEIPLIGSSDLRNYYPSLQKGGNYCSACTYAVQFSPLTVWRCGDLLLLQSLSKKVMYYFISNQINRVKQQITSKDITGVANEGYKIPENALFAIIEKAIIQIDENWTEENPSISYYHFTNYGQSPNVKIYRLPNSVFRFLAYIKTHEAYAEWRKIVLRGFRKSIKKDPSLKKHKNNVYHRLLNNQSIIYYFFQKRKILGDWELLKYYLIEVMGMKNEQLEVIKNLGEKIADQTMRTGSAKRLTQLETCRNYSELRNILRFIEKDRISLKLTGPLFTIDEFTQSLFPDDDSQYNWRYTRDILLYCIYELTHDWLVDQNLIEEDQEMEK